MIPTKRTLVLAPHTDDAELGCGGTIARLVENGTEVFVAAFSTAVDSLPQGWPPDTLKTEFMNAMSALGVRQENLFVYDFQVRRLSYHRQEVLEDLVALKRKLAPDLVLIPSAHDLHQDHEVVHNEGLRAFKDVSVFGYELPWNQISFSAQAFVELEERHIVKKWEALGHYKSQIHLARPYMNRELIEGLARLRGVQVKSAWAESFEVLRLKM